MVNDQKGWTFLNMSLCGLNSENFETHFFNSNQRFWYRFLENILVCLWENSALVETKFSPILIVSQKQWSFIYLCTKLYRFVYKYVIKPHLNSDKSINKLTIMEKSSIQVFLDSVSLALYWSPWVAYQKFVSKGMIIKNPLKCIKMARNNKFNRISSKISIELVLWTFTKIMKELNSMLPANFFTLVKWRLSTFISTKVLYQDLEDLFRKY